MSNSTNDVALTNQEIVCKIIIEDVLNHHLKGFVEISIPGEIIIKHALIEISGIATCEFPLEKNEFIFPRYYRKGLRLNGEEVFYYTRHNLCSGKVAHKHNGVKIYEFSCRWPTHLPATWIGQYGSIRYCSKVTLIQSSNVFIHNQVIVVSSRRDLSLEQHLKLETLVKVHRLISFLKYLGYVDIEVWTPFRGVATKQSIPILCSIDNHSNMMFKNIMFVLSRVDIYRATRPFTRIKTVKRDICHVSKMVNIMKGKTDYYCVLEIDEHTLATNQFHNCTCCQIVYELWVSIQSVLKCYGYCRYISIDTPGIPLIIGTQPILNYDISKMTTNVIRKKGITKTDNFEGQLEFKNEDENRKTCKNYEHIENNMDQ